MDILNERDTTIFLYDNQSKYVEAEPLYQRFQAIVEKALGPEHPNVAATLQGLAVLYLAQGRYAQAEPLYRRSLAIMEKALGPEHPNVAKSLENYAGLLRKTGRGDMATMMELRAKATRPSRPWRARLSPAAPS